MPRSETVTGHETMLVTVFDFDDLLFAPPLLDLPPPFVVFYVVDDLSTRMEQV